MTKSFIPQNLKRSRKFIDDYSDYDASASDAMSDDDAPSFR